MALFFCAQTHSCYKTLPNTNSDLCLWASSTNVASFINWERFGLTREIAFILTYNSLGLLWIWCNLLHTRSKDACMFSDFQCSATKNRIFFVANIEDQATKEKNVFKEYCFFISQYFIHYIYFLFRKDFLIGNRLDEPSTYPICVSLHANTLEKA